MPATEPLVALLSAYDLLAFAGVELVLGAVLVLFGGPRVAEHRIVPRVLQLFEDDLLPRLKAEALDEAMKSADARITDARVALEARGAEMAAQAQAAAEARIAEARAGLEKQAQEMAAQAQAALATAAPARDYSAMGKAGADTREEMAVNEQLLEAAVRAAMPDKADYVIWLAKTYADKAWRKAAKDGPDHGIAFLMQKVSPLLNRIPFPTVAGSSATPPAASPASSEGGMRAW